MHGHLIQLGHLCMDTYSVGSSMHGHLIQLGNAWTPNSVGSSMHGQIQLGHLCGPNSVGSSVAPCSLGHLWHLVGSSVAPCSVGSSVAPCSVGSSMEDQYFTLSSTLLRMCRSFNVLRSETGLNWGLTLSFLDAIISA